LQDENRENHFSLPTKTVISIGLPDEPSRLVVFNSLPRKRSEIVTVKINQPNVKVNYFNWQLIFKDF